MTVQLISEPDFLTLSSRKTAWLGAISFEERCTASLQSLARRGIRLSRTIMLDYSTQISPKNTGEALRSKNQDSMNQLGQSITDNQIEHMCLAPYSYRDGASVLETVLGSDCEQLIIDGSCVTKVHAIAMASTLAKTKSKNINTYFLYSIPENYPGIPVSRKAVGWKDILIVPFSETARFFNENSGRGLVLAGHESFRLVVALTEIEPSGGSIVFTSSPERPDLGDISYRRNLRTIRHLEAMRVADWTHKWIKMCDFERLSKIVENEVRLASERKAPTILFPFGPKPHVFGMAYELAANYYENSWFVYPVPMAYDAFYSEGVAEIVWMRIDARK